MQTLKPKICAVQPQIFENLVTSAHICAVAVDVVVDVIVTVVFVIVVRAAVVCFIAAAVVAVAVVAVAVVDAVVRSAFRGPTISHNAQNQTISTRYVNTHKRARPGSTKLLKNTFDSEPCPDPT